jgi:hypothetical protein
VQQPGNPNANVDPAFIQQRLRDMAEGLTEAIDREVARRRREGLPIHVSDNGKVVDLQKTSPESLSE